MKYTISFFSIIFFSFSIFAQQNLADKPILPNTTCEIPKNSIVLEANLENHPMIIKPFVDLDPKMNICQPLFPKVALLDPVTKFKSTTQQSKVKSVLSNKGKK